MHHCITKVWFVYELDMFCYVLSTRHTFNSQRILVSITHAFTFGEFSRRFYPKRLTMSTLVRKRRKQQYIAVGIARMFVEPSAKHKSIARLTRSPPYTTKIARTRCHMTTSIFICISDTSNTALLESLVLVIVEDFPINKPYIRWSFCFWNHPPGLFFKSKVLNFVFLRQYQRRVETA